MQRLMGTQPWHASGLSQGAQGGRDYPAILVTWDNADEFCTKLTEEEHKAKRLPEGWEYALPTKPSGNMRAGRGRKRDSALVTTKSASRICVVCEEHQGM